MNLINEEVSNHDEKDLYLVLSSTSTFIGKLIRFITHYEYNHVSLSLESDLKKMYSFARYRCNSPLAGGFVVETPVRYISGRHTPVKIKVFKIPLSDLKYREVEFQLNNMNEYKKSYIYNTFAAILYPFHKSVHIHNAYTCLDFAVHILNVAGIINSEDIYTIFKLEEKLYSYWNYQSEFGLLEQAVIVEDDMFFKKKNLLSVGYETMKHFARLTYRFGFR